MGKYHLIERVKRVKPLRVSNKDYNISSFCPFSPVPSVSPGGVSARFLCKQYKLSVSWTAVPNEFVNGNLGGYRVSLKTATNTSRFATHSTPADATAAEIPVDECRNYIVTVAAFTNTGPGNESVGLNVTSSCPCGELRSCYQIFVQVSRF